MKTRITFTLEELRDLSHILWHFTDYMGYDDRPDHGLGVLKQYREADPETKSRIAFLAGRLSRLCRNTVLRQSKPETH